MPTKREIALVNARVAGYHQDSRAFTRLLVESRVGRQYLNMEWQRGAAMRKGGIACTCLACRARAAAAWQPPTGSRPG